MKKMRKMLSVILCLVLTLSLFVPAAYATEERNVPIVFVGGRGTTLHDKDCNVIYPMTFDKKQYILDACKEILPLLGTALLTNNYDKYCDAFYEKVAAVYEEVVLPPSGVPENGSHSPFTWTKQGLAKKVRKPGDPYRLNDYAFYYDWRVDMWDVADDLSAYINDVIEVTGSPKVNLVGRCMGGNIVSAYLTKYGADKIEKCIFYATTANGTFECGGPFSGQLEVEGDSLARYASDILGDDCLNEFIRATLDLYNEATGMKLPVKMVTYIYNKIYENLVPRLLMSTYASFPSYWEMVDPGHYEAAKEFAFGGKEAEYADFIAQIDNYHNNVMLPLHDTLKTLEANGLQVYVVAKYGKQMVPITKEADCPGDDTVELTSSSFGATCSKVKSVLSKDYIAAQTEKGLERYISPDKQVDASTCLFPDKTWFVKNSKHLDFIKSIDELMLTILRYNGDMTVNDNASYPQYMVQTQEQTIEPMTSNNMNTDSAWNTNLMKAIFNFFTAMFRLLADAVRNGGFKK